MRDSVIAGRDAVERDEPESRAVSTECRRFKLVEAAVVIEVEIDADSGESHFTGALPTISVGIIEDDATEVSKRLQAKRCVVDQIARDGVDALRAREIRERREIIGSRVRDDEINALIARRIGKGNGFRMRERRCNDGRRFEIEVAEIVQHAERSCGVIRSDDDIRQAIAIQIRRTDKRRRRERAERQCAERGGIADVFDQTHFVDSGFSDEQVGIAIEIKIRCKEADRSRIRWQCDRRTRKSAVGLLQ